MAASLAILIPTLGRADTLPGLVANIDAVTATPYRIYFVMEPDDQESIEAASRLEATSVVERCGSCAVAINVGYHASVEPYVVVANDDCWFHPDWDTRALEQFRGPVEIVGLNDGYGDCRCWSMSRRSYIEEHSGVFDKPNTLFHTYKSQGPDTELAFYAMLRGVWGEAPEAVIEHRRVDADLHSKARETVLDDLAEYMRRRPLWDPQRRTPSPIPTVEPA